jgi:hypothetical protein
MLLNFILMKYYIFIYHQGGYDITNLLALLTPHL